MSASSSTTNTLPLVAAATAGMVISSGIYRGPCGGPGNRQFQTEACAAIRTVDDFDRTAMFLNNTVGDGEAETGAFLGALGGEERIVNAPQIFRGDAVAGIGHIHFHHAVILPGADFERAAVRHGVARVQEQVQEYLLEL